MPKEAIPPGVLVHVHEKGWVEGTFGLKRCGSIIKEDLHTT